MVPAAVRERLGAEATLGLAELLAAAQNEWEADVIQLTTDRFERKLSEEIGSLRLDMSEGFGAIQLEMAALRQDIATTRFELIKWSFVFWAGQVVAVAAILGVMVHRG